MTYTEFLCKTREKIRTKINDFLEDKYRLEPIDFFCNNSFDVVTHPFSLAIYGASPKGTVLSQGSHSINAEVTVEFFLNDSADIVSVNRVEEYFGAIADFLTQETFGDFSIVSVADLIRMDMGADCNEAMFLIEAKIQGTPDNYFEK